MEGPFALLPDAEPVNLSDQVSSDFDGIIHPQRILVEYSDPLERVAEWIAQGCGRSLGSGPGWVRLYRKDESRGLLAVLHGVTPEREADLIVVGHRGMLARSTLRFLAGWAFGTARLRRVGVRIPVNRPDLQDFARRCGFRHEGTARAFFLDGTDASLWAMHHADCPWLPRSAPAIPAVDVSPPSSQRMH